MKKILPRALCLLLVMALVLTAVPSADAYSPDLSALIENKEYRIHVEAMIGYYLQNDAAVRKALRDGYCAMFLFEGCSDNMDDPELSDLSYYRVSAVCVVLKLNSDGEPCVIYFNDHCSTIPDRPLEYGAWSFEDVGDVGPATICDGTYEMYSVRHGGAYEALHIRDSYEDTRLSAVYMTPEGFYPTDASYINIHTRTSNHTASRGMWSAGCLLIGDGDFEQFTQLMEVTYYALYDRFRLGDKVGTVTIDRQRLKQQMYDMYGREEAVDVILEASAGIQPEQYLGKCTYDVAYVEGKTMRAARDAEIMSLPCSNGTDVRSVTVSSVAKGEKLTILRQLYNTVGNLWYEVEYGGEQGYMFSGHVKELGWFEKLIEDLFG